MTAEMQQIIDKDREELCGEFCRSCGYCMPCTVGIDIKDCGLCNSKCPYELNTPVLLKKNLEDYEMILSGERSVNHRP